ncbi:unnamed protein product [Urochloa decumbens]|uniref:DUF4283 domain-containing protein n=1 Tax=Urochloa decumbens TaxID=240449 RepID=A0ABC9B7V5_9POAL
MATEEARLRLALIAVVGNASRDVTATEAKQAIEAAVDLRDGDIVVKPFYLDNFLVECASQGARDRVLGASPIPCLATSLSTRPWNRLAHAEDDILLSKITVKVDGIPAHAWDLDTASKLLAPHAWIERVDPATLSKDNLSTFKVAAWTRDPHALPARKKLLVAEPEVPVMHSDPNVQRIFGNLPSYLRQKRMLAYPVDFHLRSIADFRSRSPSTSGLSSPSDDGDSGPDGNPDQSYGFRQGHRGPRLSAFPRRGGRGTGDGGNGRRRSNAGDGLGRTRPAGNGPSEPEPEQAGRHCVSADAGQQSRPAFELSKEESARPVQELRPTWILSAASHGPALTGSNTAQNDGSDDCSNGRASMADPAATAGGTEAAREDGDVSETTALLAAAPAPRILQHESTPREPSGEPHGESGSQGATGSVGCIDVGAEPGASQAALGDSDASQTADSAAQDPTEDMGQITALEDFTNSIRIKLRSPLLQPPTAVSATQHDDNRADDDAADAMDEDSVARTPLHCPRPASALTKEKAAKEDELAMGRFPKRSERLAGQKLSCVPAAKRGEVILMKKFGMLDETTFIPQTIKNAYDEVYRDKVDMKQQGAAIKDLFPGGKTTGRRAPTIMVV